MLYWSKSAFETFQDCEQKFFYSNVRRLRPRVKAVAPQKGIIIHEYLDSYYTTLMHGGTADDGHSAGLTRIAGQTEMVERLIEAALSVGDDKEALEYSSLLSTINRIVLGYFETRGRADADRYDILLCERRIIVKIGPGIQSTSFIDLVAGDRVTGRAAIWEHKSTTSVPDDGIRLRDLQTILYKTVLQATDAAIPPIGEIVWNYLRTKEPATPHQNKNGVFSRSIGLDTTWSTFRQAVIDAGQDPDDYADVQARLQDHETTVFYPRFEQIILAEPKMLLHDYVVEAHRAEALVDEWKRGISQPVRRLTRGCSFCSFKNVCHVAILGGDPEDVIRMRFTEHDERH